MTGRASRSARTRRQPGASAARATESLVIAVLCMPHPLVQAAWYAAPTRRQAPLVVVGEGERVLAGCPRAASAGVHAGQRLAQARLRCPEVAWVEPDTLAAAVLYEDLLAGLSSVSPVVEAADSTGGLVYLDGRGLLRLLGDPPAIARAAMHAAAAAGLTVQAGAGPTRFLARAVTTRLGGADPPPCLLGDDAWRWLQALPLDDALFAVPPPLLEQFEAVGVRTAGRLAGLPRAALALRFGVPVLALWDQLNGAPEPPLRPWSPPAQVSACHQAEDGIEDRLVLEAILGDLVTALLAALQARGQATAQLTLRIRRAVGAQHIVRGRSWPPLGTRGPLVRGALALLGRACAAPGPEAVEGLRLEAGELVPAQAPQAPLFGDPVSARQDRLAAVLADQAGRHGAALLGRWRPDPLAADGWTHEEGPV